MSCVLEPLFVELYGVLTPPRPIAHQDEEHNEALFELLFGMQRDHFWYRGRHVLLLVAIERALPRKPGIGPPTDMPALSAIDVGGGYGGWLGYLHRERPGSLQKLALADSSRRGLGLAGPVVGQFAARYQLDFMALPWKKRWDVLALLDVLEHLPADEYAMASAAAAVRPGGLVVVTVPPEGGWTAPMEAEGETRRNEVGDVVEG